MVPLVKTRSCCVFCCLWDSDAWHDLSTVEWCAKSRKQRGRKELLKHINELCGCAPFARERTEGLKLEMEVTMYFCKIANMFSLCLYVSFLKLPCINFISANLYDKWTFSLTFPLNHHAYSIHVPRSWMHWNGWKILRCLEFVGSKAGKISVNGDMISNWAACFKKTQIGDLPGKGLTSNMGYQLSMNHWSNR